MDPHDRDSRNNAQEKVREMVPRGLARFGPHKVLFFGSHAKGTAGPDSDVDRIVMPVAGSKRRQPEAIVVEVFGLGLAKGVIVATPEEVEGFRHVPGSMFHPALRHRKVLYDRAA